MSDQLTGFRHNAVSPIGLATALPIIMSDRVAALQPPVFWLGGGEADLKCDFHCLRDSLRRYQFFGHHVGPGRGAGGEANLKCVCIV